MAVDELLSLDELSRELCALGLPASVSSLRRAIWSGRLKHASICPERHTYLFRRDDALAQMLRSPDFL